MSRRREEATNAVEVPARSRAVPENELPGGRQRAYANPYFRDLHVAPADLEARIVAECEFWNVELVRVEEVESTTSVNLPDPSDASSREVCALRGATFGTFHTFPDDDA